MKKNRINAIILFGIFLLFDISYKNSIIEMYSYMGFSTGSIPIFRNIFGYTIAVLIIYIINFKINLLFSKFTIQLIAIFLLFPAIVMFKNGNTDFQILLAHLFLFFTAYFSLKYIKFRFKGKSLKPNQRLSFLVILTIILILPFFITYKTNVNLKNFLLIDIYETRAIQSEMSNPFLGYIYAWLGRIIIPIALILSIASNSKSKFLLLIFLLSYLFLIGAHKTILIGSIVIIIFYYIPKKYIITSVSLSVLFILLLGEIIFATTHNYFIANLITRRVFFTPALLDTFYFDFFNGKPLYWSYSFLHSFINYPYDEQPTKLIAYQYFGSSEMSANNGIISDGFSNFGWIGIIINIVIVSGIFSFFNSLRISHKFFGIFILFFFSIVSSALPTLLLTHGGILLMIISQYLLKDTDK